MISFLRSHKKEILISLATGILLIYLQPILSFLGNKIVSLGIMVSDTFSDSFYRKLAKKDLSEINDWSLVILIYILSIIILATIFYMIIEFKRAKKEVGRISDKIENNKNDEQSDLNKIEVLSERILNLKTKLKSASKSITIVRAMGIFLIVLLFFIYAQMTVRRSMIIKFNNKLEILKPLIDQKEIDKLNARWVLIKNKKDFDSLSSDLKGLLMQHNIDFK